MMAKTDNDGKMSCCGKDGGCCKDGKCEMSKDSKGCCGGKMCERPAAGVVSKSSPVETRRGSNLQSEILSALSAAITRSQVSPKR